MSASSDMTPTDLDRKARELLAAEMEAAGSSTAARMLRDGWPATGATVPALAAITAALRLAVPEWRPIETAPRDRTRFLAKSRDGHISIDYWQDRRGKDTPSGKFWNEYPDDRYVEWMPLPGAAAPTLTDEGE